MKKLIYILLSTMILLSACSSSKQMLNEDVTSPVLKKEPKLIYPLNAQENNQSGTSTILFSITKDGVVSQTRIQNSSGYEELDRAAENYCKGLFFAPAQQSGEVISSNMRWDVEFNLNDFRKGMKWKTKEVKELYKDVAALNGKDKLAVQKEILQHHEDVIRNNKDVLKLNEYIYSVIKTESQGKWKSISNSYPLTFLLYHDFISRFADYDSLYLVKTKMEYAINQDLEYLQSTSNVPSDYRVNRQMLIKKIKAFVQQNYPDMNLNGLNGEMKNNAIS